MMEILKNKEGILFYFFLLVIAVLPFTMILAPISLGLLLVTYLLFGDKSNLKIEFKKNRIAFTLIIFYGFQFIGLLYSLESGFSYQRIEVLLPFLIIPLLFILLKLRLDQINKAKNVFMLSCILFCALALLTLCFNLIVNYEHRKDYNFIQRSMYHFHYPYDVLYLNTANVLLLFGSSKQFNKLIVSSLFFIIILLSGVRIALFTYLVIGTIYLIKNFKILLNPRTLLFAFFFFLVSSILVNTSQYVNDKFFDTLGKLGLNTEKYVSDIGEKYHKITLRKKIWETSMDVFQEKKIFGYGPKGSQTALNNLYIKKGYNDLIGMNSHNQFLTTLLDSGIIGLIILFILLITVLYSSYKVKSMEQFLIMIVIIVSFFTESVLVRQKGVMLCSVFFTLILIESANRIKT